MHGGANDLRELELMGVNLAGIPVLDTQTVQIAIFDEVSQSNVAMKWEWCDLERRALGDCLTKWGIPHRNLHNAGNDSWYTMALLNSMGRSSRNRCWYDGRPIQQQSMVVQWPLVHLNLLPARLMKFRSAIDSWNGQFWHGFDGWI